MKRWVAKTGICSVESLVYEEVSLPLIGPDEVLIKVKKASLNARDFAAFQAMRIPGTFGKIVVVTGI